MVMKCPACGKDCVKIAEDILANIDREYMACRDCAPEPNLDKSRPLRDLPDELQRCHSCGKATLDAVMLDALHILAEFGLRDDGETLRSVGSPLIAVGYPLAYSPRLGPRSLIIIGERLGRQAAEAIVERIPEIRGVIHSRGVPGIRGSLTMPNENVLLAGCDLRADVVQSLFGELVIYKSQSKVHIEFSRQRSPKMKILEQLYIQGRIRDVTDGLSGPGTLGLMCALAGAKRIVLNDAWSPAVQNIILNLKVNKKLLGIEQIEYLEEHLERIKAPANYVGFEPMLVCRASGKCDIEVYHGDLGRLFSKARPTELCLIDHFPGADTKELEKACRCCKEIVII
jgi:hypothetical protein